MRNICFITSSRADYDLLKPTMERFKNSKKFNLQVIATGSHLSADMGKTIDFIIDDAFEISKQIKLDNKTSLQSIIKNFGSSIEKFSNALNALNPEVVVLLGDRYEIFSASISAFLNHIPIVHLHGGELTLDSQDDIFRHCITKLSTLHFVSHPDYKKRVIQLGENPSNVFNVGPMALDSLRNLKILSLANLEKLYNFHFKDKNVLVTFHPETNKPDETVNNLKEVLKSLEKYPEVGLLFTGSNMDRLGKKFNQLIDTFVTNHNNSFKINSMGSRQYLSTLKHVNCVLGNSSSGIIEAPFFGTPTLNIGLRQEGRVKLKTVFDCEANHETIKKKLNKVFKLNSNKELSNLYSDIKESPSKVVFNTIKELDFKETTTKRFFDL